MRRILAGVLVATMLVGGAAPAKALAEEAGQTAQALTRSIASVATQLARAGGSARSGLAAQLRELAAERRSALLELVREAPGEVLKAELPSRIADRLPPDVRGMLEYRGAIEGELQVVQIDHREPGKSHLTYGLVTDSGERVSLHFAGPPTARLTDERVVARGLILEGHDETLMALESGVRGIEAAYCCAGGGGSSSEPELPNTFGAQSTAVLLVNFSDNTTQPWTVVEINDLMFGPGGISDYYHETSYNQIWLEGNVYGWLTISVTEPWCDTYEIRDLVGQAAADAGIDLYAYDRWVIFAPGRSECYFAGVASIGGSPSYAWMNGYTDVQTVTHELGHNFGLYHAHALDCGLNTMGDNCNSLTYGDKTDTMGSPDHGHFNPFQKTRLGWISEGAGEQLVSVDTSGTYELEPYETPPGSGLKAIRVSAGVDSASGAQRWLYVDYKQPIGFDSFFAARSNSYCRDDVTDGVYGHLGTDGDPDSSFLINMRTESCWVDSFGSLDWKNPRLATGLSFTIPDTGATIAVDSADPSGATVFVDLSGALLCVTGGPLVDVTPVSDNWGAPGDTVDYAVTVTSTDSADCDPASFALSATPSTGWGASFAESPLALAPGVSATTTLNVTSAGSAAGGTYDILVTAASGGDTGTDIVTYVVSNSVANNPPIARDDSAESDSSGSVTIAVLGNDEDPDNDPLAVIHVSRPGKGSVVLNGDDTVTYTPGNKANGSDSFSYTISDGADTASAAVQIAFTKGSGGGNGGSGGGRGKGGKK